MVTHTLINAFVVSAKDDQVLLERELVSDLLVEAFAVRSGEDNLVVMPLGCQFGNESVDRFDLQNHSRTEAERIIIDLAMFVEGVVTQVVDINLAQAFVLGTLHDGVIERRIKEFGTTSYDIYS